MPPFRIRFAASLASAIQGHAPWKNGVHSIPRAQSSLVFSMAYFLLSSLLPAQQYRAPAGQPAPESHGTETSIPGCNCTLLKGLSSMARGMLALEVFPSSPIQMGPAPWADPAAS